MNGKILGDGVIRGYDGRRYTFSANEIQNAQGKNINDLVGSEVDFEISNSGLAISIYITEFKSIKPQSNFLQNLSSPNLAPVSPEVQSIKTKAFIFMAMYVVSACSNGFAKLLLSSDNSSAQSIGLFLAFIAMCVIFGAYSVLYSAMESMWKMAKSATLKQNFSIYLTTLFFCSLSLFVIGVMVNSERSDGKAIFAILLFLAFIGCLIYNLILRYNVYKEVAYITNQPLFIYAFWLGVTIILSPIALIVYVIAWIGVREIRESISAEEYDKLEQENEAYNSETTQDTYSENITNDLKSLQITETQQTQINDIDFSKPNDKDTIQPIESNTKSENKDIALLTIMVIFLLICIVGFAIRYFNHQKIANMQRIDAQVATARSDMASAQKQIVAKVFADNVDVKKSKAPNGESWGEWIIEITRLDKNKWKSFGTNGVYPIDIKANRACFNESELPLLWINPRDGYMHFNPSRLSSNYKGDGFCEKLMYSYRSSGYNGDKKIPLASTGSVEF